MSHIHRREPAGQPLPRHRARGNAAKSAARVHVEHPLAYQKGVTGLVIRTIGPAACRVLGRSGCFKGLLGVMGAGSCLPRAVEPAAVVVAGYRGALG
jgi:hypothetical protein